MNPRVDISKINPKVMQSYLAIEGFLAGCGLEHKLLHLLKLRASQINGCAYCIDMHTKDARAAGETEQRLYGLNAWREAPYYSERERAALEWLEAITLITQGHAPDEVFERVRTQFSEAEIVNLTICAAQINTWNRLVIPLRFPAGTYQVGQFKQSLTASAA
jgi:AhpD family alkylhydroperoxidase